MIIDKIRKETEVQVKRLWVAKYLKKEQALLYVYGETQIPSMMFNDCSSLTVSQCKKIIGVVKKKILELNGSELV